MSLDIEILRTLATRGRLSEITNHLMTLPHAQRADAIETIQPGLSRRLSTRLNYIWPLRARDLRHRPSHSPDRADALVHAVTHLIPYTPPRGPQLSQS